MLMIFLTIASIVSLIVSLATLGHVVKLAKAKENVEVGVGLDDETKAALDLIYQICLHSAQTDLAAYQLIAMKLDTLSATMTPRSSITLN